MNQRRTIVAALAACAIAALSPLKAFSADTFPSKPIRLVVPYPPGGGADVLGRMIARRLGEAVNQAIVVENRPGANGLLGAREAAKAPPDGYTLVLVTDGMYAISPHLLPPSTKDPMKDLVPVILLAEAPLVIATRPGLGIDNMAQLIAAAKKDPGKLTFGANNTTSAHYMAAAVLQKMAGIEMRHIPFSGTAAALPNLQGGHIDLLVGQKAAMDSAMQSGQGVKYIAVSTAQRFPLLPDVPAIGETLQGYNEPVAMGLMTTAGTPPATIERLNQLVNSILQDKQVRKILLEQSGATPSGGTASQFRQLIDRQLASRGQLIQALGLTGKP